MKTELVTVTPEMAMQWLEQFKLDGQRPISSGVVARYARMMVSGEWRPGSQLSLSQNGDGRTYLVNGQHRLSAVVESGTQQVFAVLTRNENLEQARLSYQYEDAQSKRTSLDAIRVSSLHEKTGLEDNELRVLVAATIIIDNKFFYRNDATTPFRRNELVMEWHEVYSKYFEIVYQDGAVSKSHGDVVYAFSRRAVVIACSIYTLRYQSEIATSFWSNVFVPQNISVKTPEVRLREFLISHGAQSGTHRMAHVAAISKTWLAAYQGTSLSKLYTNSALPSPLFIGCPEVA